MSYDGGRGPERVTGPRVDVLLRPVVQVADATQVDAALRLHERAHDNCFIANSVNFSVRVEPQVGA